MCLNAMAFQHSGSQSVQRIHAAAGNIKREQYFHTIHPLTFGQEHILLYSMLRWLYAQGVGVAANVHILDNYF
ncbi:hypothetical protein D3C76_1817780 [compost metagenome]